MPANPADHLHDIANPHLLDTAPDACGKDGLVGVDAVVDTDGGVHEAVAITVEPELVVDDPLALFESTFGTGAEIWSSAEAREYLKNMRGAC